MVVLVAIFNSLDTVSRSQAFQADRTQNIDDMRGVLNRMTKELRQATSVTQPSASPSPTLTYVTYINDTPTTITYTASGTTLTRKVGAANPYPVLTHLASTEVFDPSSATDVTGIQWVEINLQVTPARAPDTTLELQGKVNLRNRTAALRGTSS